MALSASGLSQRQIADRLGISRGMVQRILSASDPAPESGSEAAEVAEFRRELLEALDAIWECNRHSFVKNGAVDPVLLRLERAEAMFNDEYELTGRESVQAARLRRMMAEGELAC